MDANHSLKGCVEDEWAEKRLPSYLTLPAEKVGFYRLFRSVHHSIQTFFFFFSIQTFKNKFARVTSLLEALKCLPLALRKKFSLLTMTG